MKMKSAIKNLIGLLPISSLKFFLKFLDLSKNHVSYQIQKKQRKYLEPEGEHFLFTLYDITGFAYSCDVYFLSLIAASQKNLVFVEYGVYCGRSFFNTLVNLDAQKKRISDPSSFDSITAIAIDPFPNLEKAKDEFINNLEKFQSIFRERVLIRYYENHDLSDDNHHKFSLIHIDSCHTEREVLADFSSAFSRLKPEGVIVFDDVWSDIFPGVTSGVFKVIHDFQLSVFLVTSAKIYICQSEYHSFYFELISQQLSDLKIDFYTSFASENFSQENDIRGLPVISLKQLVGQQLINNEIFINKLFKTIPLRQ